MSDTPRYDILFVPSQRDLALPEGAMATLIRHLAGVRIGRPVDEAVADKWVEVYMEPGPSAHEVFVRGGYDGEQPIFLEMVARVGSKPVRLLYGARCEAVNVFLEVRGAIIDAPIGHFIKKVNDLMRVRMDIYRRDHDGLPEHAVVAEDEQPRDRRRKPGGGPGQAGTSVEEW